nr:hypothetical protein [Rickettsiales bacterium]
MPDEPNSFNENKKTSVVEKFLQNTDKHIAPASLRVINSVFSKKNPISNRGAATLPRVVKNGANSLLIKEELGKNFTEIMRSQELNDNHRSILTLIYDIETKPINVVTGDVKKVDYLLNIINQDLDLLDNVSANKLVNDPKYSEQAKYINSVATLILPPNSKQALFGSRVA